MTETAFAVIVFAAILLFCAALVLSAIKTGGLLADLLIYKQDPAIHQKPNALRWLWSIPIVLPLIVVLVTLLFASYAIAQSIL